MPLDHLLDMDHIDLAARCYTAEARAEAAEAALREIAAMNPTVLGVESARAALALADRNTT